MIFSNISTSQPSEGVPRGSERADQGRKPRTAPHSSSGRRAVAHWLPAIGCDLRRAGSRTPRRKAWVRASDSGSAPSHVARKHTSFSGWFSSLNLFRGIHEATSGYGGRLEEDPQWRQLQTTVNNASSADV